MLATEEYAPSVDRGCPMVLGGPLSHVMAAKAVALAEARQPAFQTYAQSIADNAKSLAEGFLKRGGKLVTGGTDNHLVLIDVSGFGLTGRQAESALLDAGIVTNRNSVPHDPNGAWYTSGVRIGTPALTTRGFGADEFDKVAELMIDVLSNTTPGDDQGRRPVQGHVRPRRRCRRPRQGRLRRDARRAPAVPGPRADLTFELRLVMRPTLRLVITTRRNSTHHEAQLNIRNPVQAERRDGGAVGDLGVEGGRRRAVEELDRDGGQAAHHQHVQGVGAADDGFGDVAALVAQSPHVRRHVGVVASRRGRRRGPCRSGRRR